MVNGWSTIETLRLREIAARSSCASALLLFKFSCNAAVQVDHLRFSID